MDDNSDLVRALNQSDRQKRLDDHCRNMCRTLLDAPQHLKDVTFKCSDWHYVPAHKFVLGAQSEYLRNLLYRRGENDINNNGIIGKVYAFAGTRECFNALLQFLYLGYIEDLEGDNACLDPLPQPLVQLFQLSLAPHRNGLGGVDQYIIRKLCDDPPPSAKAAIGRLSLGCNHRCQAVVDAMVRKLPQLDFAADSFQAKDTSEEVVKLVLTDVAIEADELMVTRAVNNWAREFYPPMDIVDISDDLEDEFQGSTQATDTEEPQGWVPNEITSLLDLLYVNPTDIQGEVKKMGLFPSRVVRKALVDHWKFGTVDKPTRKNDKRGKGKGKKK